MRAFVLAATFVLSMSGGVSAQSSQSCDGAYLTAKGRIESAKSLADRYVIETRIPRCEEVEIVGPGRLPRGCIKGATVSATGRLEEFINVFLLMDPAQITCN